MKIKTTLAYATLCTFFLSFFFLSHAYAKAPSKATVMATLEGYEWQINYQQIENLGPDADVTLIEIIEDPTILNFYQIRALEVLRLFPKERVARFLEEYTNRSNTSDVHLKRAIDSYSRAFSAVEPMRVQEFTAPFLQHRNIHVQITAARSLTRVPLLEAEGLVSRYIEDQPQEWIKQKVSKREFPYSFERGIPQPVFQAEESP